MGFLKPFIFLVALAGGPKFGISPLKHSFWRNITDSTMRGNCVVKAKPAQGYISVFMLKWQVF